MSADLLEFGGEAGALIFPSKYSCVVHGRHPDWVQFRWSGKAGESHIFCLRCFADHLQAVLPAGGIVVPPVTGGAS